jgi:hypothetical protein
MLSKLFEHLFSIFDLAKRATTGITKNVFVKWVPRTNEAAGRIIYPLIKLKIKLGFGARCLFGPESTWTSSPSWYPRRWFCLDQTLLVSKSYIKVLTLKSCYSTRSKTIKIIIIEIIELSERRLRFKTFNFKFKYLRPDSKFKLSRDEKLPIRCLHKTLPWLSYGSLKG